MARAAKLPIARPRQQGWCEQACGYIVALWSNSGQFTQEDPIGIAGGLDLYGYAGGDPVNFSDPFGLRAEADCEPICTAVDLAFLAADIKSIRDDGLGVGNAIGVGLGVLSVLTPFVTGLGAADNVLGLADDAAEAAGGARFIATSGGDVLPVPAGARGPSSTRGPGMQFQGGSGGNGLDSRVTGIRVMDPTMQNPQFRATYMNASGQTVHPFTGLTVSRSSP